MHMVTINNNTTCNTGHLHISLLACGKHRCCQNYKICFRSSLMEANVIFVYQTKNGFCNTNDIKVYLIM